MPVAKTARGLRIFYDRHESAHRAGAAPPSVILAIAHLGTNRHMWRPAVDEANRRGYTFLTVDHRGVGRSDAPWRPWTTRHMAADCAAVLDHAGVDAAHIWGISLGGMIAQQFALCYPQRTATLALLATTAGSPRLDLMSTRQLLRITAAQWPTTALRDAAIARLMRALTSPRFAQTVLPATAAWTMADRVLDEPPTRRGIIYQLAAGTWHGTWRKLKHITAPTIVAHGTADTLFRTQAGRLIAQRIPDAGFIALENMGHGLTFQCPELLLPALFEFIARNDASTSSPA